MTKLSDLKTTWMDDPEFRREYGALAAEFDVSEMLVTMRKQGQLTQEQMAERLRTTQSAVARLESSRSRHTVDVCGQGALSHEIGTI